jgi:hypothetical protein
MAETVVKTGQIWRIGRHLVAVGDCLNPAVRQSVLNGTNYGTALFDPEWDKLPKCVPDEIANANSVLAFCGTIHVQSVMRLFPDRELAQLFVWNCQSFNWRKGRPLMGVKLCLWFGDHSNYQNIARYGDPKKYHGRIPGHLLGDRYDESITQTVKNSGHSYAKPITWIKCLLENCTTGHIFDPYLGSGSTLFAAESMDDARSVYGIEISLERVSSLIDRAICNGLDVELLGYV